MDKITKVFTRANAKHWPANLEKILRHYWQNSDKDLTVTVEEAEDNRRIAQNRLLFMWHNELSKHIDETTGQKFSSDDIHEYVAEQLLPKRAITLDNNPIIVRTKTSKLKVKEFAEFLTRYDIWANEKYNCKFTHPDDLYLKAVMKDEK